MVLLKVIEFKKMVEGFSSVEYLIVFNAIVYGFITSYFFENWGRMIQNRSDTKFSTEHIAWTIFIFLSLITNWYGTWHRVNFINNGVGYFFYSLLPPLVYYFIANLLFPPRNRASDFEKYLNKNKRAIFIIFSINLCLSVINGFVYEENEFLDQQTIIRLAGVSVGLAGVITSNKYVHRTILTLGYIFLIVFLTTMPAFID